MNLSYVLRLLSLSLASFFLVTAAAGALVACFSGVAIRFAENMPVASAARFLFAMRIAPAALAIFIVAGLCVPSYLWLEPESATEQVGGFCAAAAITMAAFWMHSILRSTRAVLQSNRYLKSCREAGQRTSVAGEAAILIQTPRTTALVGLFHPEIVVSRDVLEALSAEQISAAVLHERSHSVSRDNLKRLAILIAPAIFPLKNVEQAWRRFAEWAADDLAVAGDQRRAIALAEALIRVARMGSAPQTAPLTTSLLDEDLSARVDRLLNGNPPPGAYRWKPIAAACAVIAAATLRPSTLDLVHRALEKLIH